MDNSRNAVKKLSSDSPSVFVKPMPRATNGRKRAYPVLLGVIILALIAASGYFYLQYRSVKNDTNAATLQENRKLVARVSKLIELPQGVDPTVATVNKKEQLQDQDFFKGAENGDKILIYPTSKMAILYRPSINKIMKVAPLVSEQNDSNVNSNTNTASQGPSNTNATAP